MNKVNGFVLSAVAVNHVLSKVAAELASSKQEKVTKVASEDAVRSAVDALISSGALVEARRESFMTKMGSDMNETLGVVTALCARVRKLSTDLAAATLENRELRETLPHATVTPKRAEETEEGKKTAGDDLTPSERRLVDIMAGKK